MSPWENRELLEKLLPRPIRWTNFEGRTNCPFHDDRRPSFSVNVEKGVWICHASCGSGTLQSLYEMLGESTPVLHSVSKGSEAHTHWKKSRQHENEYVYRDIDGLPVFLFGRDSSPEKRFAMYHFSGGEWYTGKGSHDSIPYRLPEVRLAIQTGVPIVVVEGEKDADTLNQLFSPSQLIATTNMGGASNWSKEAQYNAYFRDADIYIIPDNDDAGRKHANHVMEAVGKYAKSIRIVQLPDLPPKGDVTDWFALGNQSTDFLTLMESMPEASLTVPEKIDVDVLRNYFDGNTFVPALLAKDIQRDYSFFYDGNRLFAYHNGVYRPNGDLVVRQLCQRMLGNETRIYRTKEVTSYIETESYVDSSQINNDDGQISLLNGLLSLKDYNLQPHTADRLSTIQLPVQFDPEATCPRIEEFFKQVLPEDSIVTVSEFIGYCLMMNAKYEKALMLTGSGSNGKSTFIKLIAAFLGKGNTTSIPLQELSESRWKRADLQGALLNSFADISSKQLETSSIFKAIVSGDEIDAERKGKDPFYFKPYSKLLFSANEIPGSKDISRAFIRRWLIVPFPNSFEYGGNADPDLIGKLTMQEELSGLLNLALEGLRRLQTNKQFTESASANKAKTDFIIVADSVAGFVDECCTVQEEAECLTYLLYSGYENWCTTSGYKPLGKIRFHRRLLELIPGLTRGRRAEQSTEHWKGITIS